MLNRERAKHFRIGSFGHLPIQPEEMIKHKLLNYVIAGVWLINGLFCKVLNLVPRHQEIVARILGNEHARLLTILIGVAEIIMAIWILSGIKTRLNAIAQILVIAAMNIFTAMNFG